MAINKSTKDSAKTAAPSGKRSSVSKRFLLREKSPFMMREAYKALRTNISFSLPGTDAKCIGVTSPSRGEGKSTNSVNVAISFAQIGKKVILLDCDLRLPTVASKLGVMGRPGLSDFLVGEASWDSVLRKDVEGVDVVPAGSIPVDPTGLLESTQIETFFEKMREMYDYIIVDLPPMNVVADAAILSRCIDGYVLVVRHGETRNRDVAEMMRQLNMAGARVLGFVYNDAPVEGKRYYYRSYYGKK